jgi:Na+/H+ antiporter NhaA
VDLGLAALVLAALVALNLAGLMRLAPYLLLDLLLWFFTFRSGVHATIAGVLLALCMPLKRTPAAPEAHPHESPLHRLELALIRPVAFLIVPMFGFANAGVSFAGLGGDVLLAPVTLGVAAGLSAGKLIGTLLRVISGPSSSGPDSSGRGEESRRAERSKCQYRHRRCDTHEWPLSENFLRQSNVR